MRLWLLPLILILAGCSDQSKVSSLSPIPAGEIPTQTLPAGKKLVHLGWAPVPTDDGFRVAMYFTLRDIHPGERLETYDVYEDQVLVRHLKEIPAAPVSKKIKTEPLIP